MHVTSGEPDVKMGGKEMENQQEANNMMRILERMLQEQQAMLEVLAIVEWLVQRNMQFNRKEVSRYLRDYTAEMMWWGISEELQVTSCWETGPSGREPTKLEKETGPNESGRNPTESDGEPKTGTYL